jgi:rhomboid protease GluP
MNVQPEPLQPPRPRILPVPGVRPVLTYAIMAVTILVFIGQVTLGEAFTAAGDKDNQLILQGEYWRFITPIFLHASIWHIFFNMYALYNVGRQIERPLGYARFGMIYFFSGVAGVFASFLLTKGNSLGASGAIFGLIGALAVFLHRNSRLFGSAGRSMLGQVVFIILLNLSLSLTPGIDLWGHVGGLISGAALTWALGPVWKIVVDPYTGYPAAVDGNPLSRHVTAAFFALFALYAATLWLLVR